MLAVAGGDEVCEEETAIGDVGEAEAVLAVEAFGFGEGARGGGGCGEEFEGGDGDLGGGVGEALFC